MELDQMMYVGKHPNIIELIGVCSMKGSTQKENYGLLSFEIIHTNAWKFSINLNISSFLFVFFTNVKAKIIVLKILRHGIELV